MEALIVDRPADGVVRLAMNSQRNKNALGDNMRGVLVSAFEAAFSDAGVRAIVITGAEKDFSAGGDLSKMDGLNTPAAARQRISSAHRFVRLLAAAEKPIVAAVAGYAVGAGAGLALMADTIVMAADAKIGFPFFKVGLVPDFAIPYALARRCGGGLARQALLYARTYEAAEAMRLGIADHVVPAGEMAAKAVALASELAAMPAQAMALTKRMLSAMPANFEAVLEMEAMAQSLCWVAPDFAEGVAAFREKRQPHFNR